MPSYLFWFLIQCRKKRESIQIYNNDLLSIFDDKTNEISCLNILLFYCYLWGSTMNAKLDILLIHNSQANTRVCVFSSTINIIIIIKPNIRVITPRNGWLFLLFKFWYFCFCFHFVVKWRQFNWNLAQWTSIDKAYHMHENELFHLYYFVEFDGNSCFIFIV